MRSFRVFSATVKEGIKGLWKNRFMGIASVISITLALIILGFILIGTLILNQAVLDIQVRVDEVDLLLEEDISSEDILHLKELFERDDRIREVHFFTKEDNLENFSKTIDVDDYLLEGMEEAFPDSFTLIMEDIEHTDSLVKDLKTERGIENIRYYQDVIEKMIRISRMVQIGGAIAVGVLVIISILIISNTIKLTIYARRKEIMIKKYLGASSLVITNPFLIEGVIFGLLGSLLAYFAVFYSYNFFVGKYGTKIFQLLSTYLIDPDLLSRDILKIFLALGIGIGSLGSLISIQRYSKV